MPALVANPTEPCIRPSRYRFGRSSIDLATRELRRDGALLTLSPKLFDCIAYLIAHRDRAIGRDELGAAVWGRADVTDAQLRQLMYKARYAVSDGGGSQDVIRTIPHFGFRWVAELSPCDGEPEPGTVAASPAPGAESQSRFATAGTLAWCCLVLVAALAGSFAWRHRGVTSARSDARTEQQRSALAVLPAEIDAAADGDAGWMRLGLMDAIAGSLRKAAVGVVASEDVVALVHAKGGAERALADRVRDATGANMLVSPSASHRRDGWTLRLTLDEGGGRHRSVEAFSPDALIAAREASDRLLALLGKAPGSAESASASTVAELLQRVDAALLVDDFDAARRLIEMAPAALRELPESQLDLARVDLATDRDEAARTRLAALVSTVAAQDDPLLRARILTAMGRADFAVPDLAVREFSDAIALLERLDEPLHLGTAYKDRAIAEAALNRVAEAREDYARARVAFTLANDGLDLAGIDNNEAILVAERGHPAEALPLFERAAATFERFGMLDTLVNPVINQMTAYLDILQPADALRVYERIQPKLEMLQSRESLHVFQYVGATTLARNGRLSDARRMLRSLATAANAPDEAGLLAAIESSEAELDLAAGAFDAAVAHAERAEQGIADSREPHRFDGALADAWLTRVRALRGADRAAEAHSQAQLFLEWARNTDKPMIAIRAGLAEAEQQWNEGQRPRAKQSYEGLLLTAERAGTPADVVATASSYAYALLDDEDYDRASVLFGRIGRWAASDFGCALLQVRLYQAIGRFDAWRTALANAQALSGERPIPRALAVPPHAVAQQR